MAFGPDLSTIHQARELLARYLPVTRAVAARSLSSDGAPVHLKLETDLPTGSFKPRGAIYALATNLGRRKIAEVTASSTGNHGAAVAYAGNVLGVPATIFLPANPNPVKRDKIRELGARIIESGAADLAQAFQQAAEYSRRPGVYFLNDATDPDLPAGPGSQATHPQSEDHRSAGGARSLLLPVVEGGDNRSNRHLQHLRRRARHTH